MARTVTARGRSGRQVTSLSGRAARVVTASGGRNGKVIHGRSNRVTVTGIGAATLVLFAASLSSSSPPLGLDVTGVAVSTLTMSGAAAGRFTAAVTGTGAATLVLAADATGAFTPEITGAGDVTLAGFTGSAEGSGGAVSGTADATLTLAADAAGTHLVPVIGAAAGLFAVSAAGVGQVLSPVTGAAAAALAVAASGAGTSGSGSTGIAVVGPHANFTGTPGSGDAAPTDPVRTGPKAIGQIATCPGQRVSGQLLLKIPCDAYGGIAQVNLSGDCEATTITSMSLVQVVDVNNVPHNEFYHCVYLDAAAFVAKGGTAGSRQANIYVEVVPTLWPTVQKRVLSFYFYPEATNTDGTYNVGAGQPYTTIKAAFAQARTDARKAPLIQIKTSGFYEMEDSTWGAYTGGKGFAVITTDPGVTATIRRAADFSPTNAASWKWTPGWDGIEFRGAGIVFDVKNTTQVVMNVKPCLFNGCKITNSIGTRDSLYWNKSPHPGWGPSTASWWQYHDFEFGGSPMQFQLGVVGSTSRATMGDIYTGTPLVYGPHDEDSNGEWYRQGASTHGGLLAMTVRYNDGAGGLATIAKTGGNGSGALVLVDPAGTLTIQLGSISDLVEIDSVVTTINARANWTATAQDTTRSARYFRGYDFGDTNGFVATDCATADVQLATLVDIHADGTQTYGGKENFIYWNWTLDSNVNMSSVLFFDGEGASSGGLGDRDMSFVNCVLLADQSGAIGLGGPGAHHKVFRHLTTTVWVSPNATPPQEIYTEMTNCIVAGIGGGSLAPPVHFYNNLHTVPHGSTAPSGATYTGNVALGDARDVAITSFLANPAGHDFTPISTALTTQYASVFPYDARGVLRSANDSAGAWSKNAA